MKRFINVDSVRIRPDRIRKEFSEEANQELQNSIRSLGLLQPIVLSFEADEYWLEAGERRLIAVKEIYALGGSFRHGDDPVPPGLIPHVLFTELSELDRLQIEVDENNKRVQFTWQERAAATAKLEKLRSLQAQAGEIAPPTPASLALEVRGTTAPSAAAATRKELLVSRHLDDPDVQGAKTADEAFKLIQRKEERARHTALAEKVGAVMNSGHHTCVQADSLEWMLTQESETFDVILTDPPYGMGADGFGDAGGKTGSAHNYDDSPEEVNFLVELVPPQLYRLAKAEAHAYLFCDLEYFQVWRDSMEDAGWKVFRTPLIWFKPSAYRAPWPEQGPQRKYECILYAVKGDKRTLKLGGDVIQCNTDANLGHNAQKPVALFEELLSRSARPGSRILDPFCGSGPIFPAAHACKCYATGIEQDSAAYGIALGRLKALDAQLNLPL
jgi:DNA modification methylase